jgi:hypothetical protein
MSNMRLQEQFIHTKIYFLSILQFRRLSHVLRDLFIERIRPQMYESTVQPGMDASIYVGQFHRRLSE